MLLMCAIFVVVFGPYLHILDICIAVTVAMIALYSDDNHDDDGDDDDDVRL